MWYYLTDAKDKLSKNYPLKHGEKFPHFSFNGAQTLKLPVKIRGSNLGSIDWSIIPYTKRCQIGFQVGTHTKVADFMPDQGTYDRNGLKFLSCK